MILPQFKDEIHNLWSSKGSLKIIPDGQNTQTISNKKGILEKDHCQPADALVTRLTGEASIAEQISVMAGTICPQVTIIYV